MRTSPHPDQRPFIEGCLAHPAPEVRAAAVAALGAQRGEVIARLAAAVFDPEPLVRRAALAAIAEARTALARRILLQALEGDSAVQLDAVRALAALDDAAVVPPLMRLLRARAPELRRAAVATLGGFGTPTIIRQLAALAVDPDAGVREEVARALATSDDPAALATLERLSLDIHAGTAEIARARLARPA
jgi:HEAT repeat protein